MKRWKLTKPKQNQNQTKESNQHKGKRNYPKNDVTEDSNESKLVKKQTQASFCHPFVTALFLFLYYKMEIMIVLSSGMVLRIVSFVNCKGYGSVWHTDIRLSSLAQLLSEKEAGKASFKCLRHRVESSKYVYAWRCGRGKGDLIILHLDCTVGSKLVSYLPLPYLFLTFSLPWSESTLL